MEHHKCVSHIPLGITTTQYIANHSTLIDQLRRNARAAIMLWLPNARRSATKTPDQKKIIPINRSIRLQIMNASRRIVPHIYCSNIHIFIERPNPIRAAHLENQETPRAPRSTNAHK